MLYYNEVVNKIKTIVIVIVVHSLEDLIKSLLLHLVPISAWLSVQIVCGSASDIRK